MTVNVYFFREDNVTPADQTDMTTFYENRIVLLGGTPLSTGGTSTHTHTPTAATSSTAGGASIYGFVESEPYTWCAGVHSHDTGYLASYDSSNYPATLSMRLLRRSVSGWDGSVPDGTVALNDGPPSILSGWSRTGTSTTRFPVISSTPGETTENIHEHDVVYATDYDDSSVLSAIISPAPRAAYGHYHVYSGTFTTVPYDYYSCGMSFVKATGGTQYIRKGMHALFDGDPGANWTLDTSGDGHYLKFGNLKTNGGSYLSLGLHSHAETITTGPPDSTTDLYTTYGAFAASSEFHTHTVLITLQNVTADAPPYVRLLLYYSNIDFQPSEYEGKYSLPGIFFGDTNKEAIAHSIIWTRLPMVNNINVSIFQQGMISIFTRNTTGSRTTGDLMFYADTQAILGAPDKVVSIKSYIQRHRGLIATSAKDILGKNIIR